MKAFLLGFIAASLLGLSGIACFLFLGNSSNVPLFHDQVVSPGKKVKVMACNFVWGSEHSDRFPNRDCFALEYASSSPTSNPKLRDQEAVEVFELIRPVSELWGLDRAETHVFPSTKRSGPYDVYSFTRNADGKWSFEQHSAKVHAND